MEQRLPPGSVVPPERHRRHRDVSPAVRDPHRVQVDVPAPPPVRTDERVRRARVTVTDDDPVGRRLRTETARAADGVGGSVGGSTARAIEPVRGRPRERAVVDGQRVVQRAQALAHRDHRGPGLVVPARVDGAPAGHRSGVQPDAVVVGAVVEHLGDPRVPGRPRQPRGLAADPRTVGVRQHLHELLGVRVRSDAERRPADLVVPDERDLTPPGHLGDHARHRDGLTRQGQSTDRAHHGDAQCTRSGREDPDPPRAISSSTGRRSPSRASRSATTASTRSVISRGAAPRRGRTRTRIARPPRTR